jgi:hypothetical protein
MTNDLDGLSEGELRNLLTATRTGIAFLRSEQKASGPDRSEEIATQQKKLRAIISRLEAMKTGLSG